MRKVIDRVILETFYFCTYAIGRSRITSRTECHSRPIAYVAVAAICFDVTVVDRIRSQAYTGRRRVKYRESVGSITVENIGGSMVEVRSSNRYRRYFQRILLSILATYPTDYSRSIFYIHSRKFHRSKTSPLCKYSYTIECYTFTVGIAVLKSNLNTFGISSNILPQLQPYFLPSVDTLVISSDRSPLVVTSGYTIIYF